MEFKEYHGKFELDMLTKGGHNLCVRPINKIGLKNMRRNEKPVLVKHAKNVKLSQHVSLIVIEGDKIYQIYECSFY